MKRILLTLAMLLFASLSARAVELQWLGHATVKLTSEDGRVIVIDPFLTGNPKTPEEFKDLSKLGKVDLILVTHGHGDHIADLAGLAGMTGAKVMANADLGRLFLQFGWVATDKMIRVNKGAPLMPLGEGITVTMVRAEHSSNVYAPDPGGDGKRLFPGGEPAGYVIEFEGDATIYHAGDTAAFGDMAMIRERHAPDVALLPIGGHFTMGPESAAYALDTLLETPKVVPIHWGTFGLLTGTPERLEAALGEGGAEVIEMVPGETRRF